MALQAWKGDCCPRLALWRQRSKDSWDLKTLPGSLLVPGTSPVEICGRSETSLEILGLVRRAVIHRVQGSKCSILLVPCLCGRHNGQDPAVGQNSRVTTGQGAGPL